MQFVLRPSRLLVPVGQPPLPPVPVAPRRRNKVWDLRDRYHCPLVGTCISIADLRRLARRAGLDEAEMSDYTLHTVVVGHCAGNGDVAHRVQRFLDERYRAAVARFLRVRGEQHVLALWREAMASGEIADALWAAWSHPDLGDDGAMTIFGDVHMLSHQVGATARADLRRLEHLTKESARLRDEAAALRLGLAEAERQRDRLRADLERRLADAEARAALLPRREAELAEALRAAGDYADLHERAERLARHVKALEERNAAGARRTELMESAFAEARRELVAAEDALEAALGTCDGIAGTSGCGKACPAEVRLDGRCVLCIGGKTHLVSGYRRLVETQGGRFLHHDGGQEDNLHRIDAVVSSADAVVCQAGCVSHAAYYRIKETCKKLGKPCVFVKSPGVTSFARGLIDIAVKREERPPH